MSPCGCSASGREQHGIEIVQLAAADPKSRVIAGGEASDCDLIVSIGGDGTTLAALRAGAVADRPVLGIACGSLGALANVMFPDAPRALERFSRGDWLPRRFPALSVARPVGESLFAVNDVALVRASGGQVRLTASVDGSAVRPHRGRRRRREHADRHERLRDLRRRSSAAAPRRRLRPHASAQARRLRPPARDRLPVRARRSTSPAVSPARGSRSTGRLRATAPVQ